MYSVLTGRAVIHFSCCDNIRFPVYFFRLVPFCTPSPLFFCFAISPFPFRVFSRLFPAISRDALFADCDVRSRARARACVNFNSHLFALSLTASDTLRRRERGSFPRTSFLARARTASPDLKRRLHVAFRLELLPLRTMFPDLKH